MWWNWLRMTAVFAPGVSIYAVSEIGVRDQAKLRRARLVGANVSTKLAQKRLHNRGRLSP
jgi:hypothetical protein